MNWQEVKNMLLAAKNDYSQLFEKDRPISNDVNLLLKKLSRNVPSNADFRNPQAMSQWAQAAALNAPMMGVVGKLPPTKFSRAHDLAQKNAALPIEQGGLGLPSNNSSMDRARAMGAKADYPINAVKKAYKEGINAKIKYMEIENDIDNPFYSYDHYLNEINSYNPDSVQSVSFLNGANGMDMPVLTTGYRYGDAPIVSKNYRDNFSEDGVSMAKTYHPNNDKWENTISSMFIKNGRKKKYYAGFDAGNKGSDGEPLFNNLVKITAKNAKLGYIEPTFTINTGRKRSRFAAFDPMQKDSANILASILLGTSLYGSYGDDQ